MSGEIIYLVPRDDENSMFWSDEAAPTPDHDESEAITYMREDVYENHISGVENELSKANSRIVELEAELSKGNRERADIDRWLATLVAPETSDDPVPGEWIDWTGGERPVDYDVDVWVKLRDGHKGTREAGDYRWDWRSNDSDIIKYRVLEQSE